MGLPSLFCLQRYRNIKFNLKGSWMFFWDFPFSFKSLIKPLCALKGERVQKTLLLNSAGTFPHDWQQRLVWQSRFLPHSLVQTWTAITHPPICEGSRRIFHHRLVEHEAPRTHLSTFQIMVRAQTLFWKVLVTAWWTGCYVDCCYVLSHSFQILLNPTSIYRSVIINLSKAAG